ncbi:hypothetical protein AtNW77_Chr1g0048141 [Arabidopsis thaliana]
MPFRAGYSGELAFLAELAGLDEQTSLDELTCVDELTCIAALTCLVLSPGVQKSVFSRDFLFLIYTRPYSRVRKVNSRECPFCAAKLSSRPGRVSAQWAGSGSKVMVGAGPLFLEMGRLIIEAQLMYQQLSPNPMFGCGRRI